MECSITANGTQVCLVAVLKAQKIKNSNNLN